VNITDYIPVGEYNRLINTSNLTNHLVGYVMFTCGKILIPIGLITDEKTGKTAKEN
jgi:hypothetical protein